MLLAAESWRSREAARHALADGDFLGAKRLASQAQELCFTPVGEKLRLLTAWLALPQ